MWGFATAKRTLKDASVDTLLVAGLSFAGLIVAYHTYGRWLAKHIFGVDAHAPVPSHQLRDDVDYVPTKKSIIFGHHFTSIAGTGPIVRPSIRLVSALMHAQAQEQPFFFTGKSVPIKPCHINSAIRVLSNYTVAFFSS